MSVARVITIAAVLAFGAGCEKKESEAPKKAPAVAVDAAPAPRVVAVDAAPQAVAVDAGAQAASVDAAVPEGEDQKGKGKGKGKGTGTGAGTGTGTGAGTGAGTGTGAGAGTGTGTGAGAGAGIGGGGESDGGYVAGGGLGNGSTDPCAALLCKKPYRCVTYYGVAGAKGPAFASCEITCKSDADCPKGTSCGIVSDGPGQVCR